MILNAMRRQAARLNRRVVRHWPIALGRSIAYRALHKVVSHPGVRLDGHATWGGRFQCDLHDFVASRIYYFGVWEPNLTAFITRRLARGDVFVDVGANMGYFSVLASQLVGPTGRVVAFEASPTTHALLVEDLVLNDATNARAVNVAVSDRAGTLALYSGPPDNRGATSLHAERGGAYETHVRAAPLLELIEPEERARLRLMKIDVEGAELPILLDLLEHVDAYPSQLEIVVEIAPDEMRAAGVSVDALIARFAAVGYHWYVLANDHDPHAYFETTPHPPVRGTSLPAKRSDLIFSREDAPALV